jgi:hypothetical protein
MTIINNIGYRILIALIRTPIVYNPSVMTKKTFPLGMSNI